MRAVASPVSERCKSRGERAHLGRSGPRPRGPLDTREPAHCLVPSFVFGARARRTAAEAAALPIQFDCIVPAEGELETVLRVMFKLERRGLCFVNIRLARSLLHCHVAADDAFEVPVLRAQEQSAVGVE